MTTPPKSIPEEVRKEDDAARLGQVRAGSVLAMCCYAFAAANGPWLFGIGYKPSTAFFVTQAAWLVPIGTALLMHFRPSYPTLFCMLVTGVISTVCAGVFLSPYLLVPGLLTVHAVAYSLMHGWRRRILVIAIVLAGWTASLLGEWLGLFPHTIQFMQDGVLIRTGSALNETAMRLYMYLSVLATITLAAVAVGAVRAASAKNELTVRLQAWQLKQLVPEGSQEG